MFKFWYGKHKNLTAKRCYRCNGSSLIPRSFRNYCEECGRVLHRKCIKEGCHHSVSVSTKFCVECGTKQVD